MVTKKDLADITNENRSGEFLLCKDCGGEFSASHGDYFMRGEDEPFICQCGNPLVLATKRTIFNIIKE